MARVGVEHRPRPGIRASAREVPDVQVPAEIDPRQLQQPVAIQVRRGGRIDREGADIHRRFREAGENRPVDGIGAQRIGRLIRHHHVRLAVAVEIRQSRGTDTEERVGDRAVVAHRPARQGSSVRMPGIEEVDQGSVLDHPRQPGDDLG